MNGASFTSIILLLWLCQQKDASAHPPAHTDFTWYTSLPYFQETRFLKGFYIIYLFFSCTVKADFVNS